MDVYLEEIVLCYEGIINIKTKILYLIYGLKYINTVAPVLIAQLGFLMKCALKMCCANSFFQTKVVTNHNTQLLVQKFF